MPDEKVDPEVLKHRAQRTAALRQQFLKETLNPHRHATGEGGVVFDSAVQRFMAMNVTYYDHFKPTAKSGFWFIGLSLVPILGFAYLLHTSKAEQEKLYRTGQVSYADRQFKFA